MKSIFSASLFTAALLFSTTSAHSWLECCRDEPKNYDSVKADPSLPLETQCDGYPRNKVDNGDWIAESTNYLWDLAGERASNEEGGRHACHPGQRSPTYPDKAPAAKAKAGETLRLRFWGNGHTSWEYGSPNHRDPGLVRVYWAGSPDAEISKASELTVDKLMSESNFSADAASRLKEDGASDDKANWMSLTLPPNFPNGRNMFVWTWAPIKDDFIGGWRDRYTTCFDLFVDGGSNDLQPSPSPPQAPQDDQSKIKEQCAKTCYRGGMKEQPCSDSNCPPCRYGENCFAYDGSGKCPAWAGGFDCSTGQAI